MCIEDAKPAPVMATCARATAACGSRRRDHTWGGFDPSGSPREGRGPHAGRSLSDLSQRRQAAETPRRSGSPREARGPFAGRSFSDLSPRRQAAKPPRRSGSPREARGPFAVRWFSDFSPRRHSAMPPRREGSPREGRGPFAGRSFATRSASGELAAGAYGFCFFDQSGSGSPLPLPAGFSTGGVVAEPVPLVALPVLAPEPLSGVTVEAEPAPEPLPVGLCGGVLTTTGATTRFVSTEAVIMSSASCIVLDPST